MDIDRRRLLVGSAGVALTRVFGAVPVRFDVQPPDSIDWMEWHPLSRFLLERARGIGRSGIPPDRALIERKILQLAHSASHVERPVIKWMDTPSDAFEYLSRFGLDALLDMGTTGFWRRSLRPEGPDADAVRACLRRSAGGGRTARRGGAGSTSDGPEVTRQVSGNVASDVG